MRSRHILLIEHEPAVQMILIDVFMHAGYEVCAAISTSDVQAMLDWCQPDVAIVSGGSRGTFASGWQMAQLIASIDPALPLVMLTTNRAVLQELGQTERGKLFAAGLLKPFDLHELRATVARSMRSSRAEQPSHASELGLMAGADVRQ